MIDHVPEIKRFVIVAVTYFVYSLQTFKTTKQMHKAIP